ncbi:hypothetical protein CCR75_008739 [Bremia lactucae]|uniref:CCDC93 coiled-coil domain-containing protein n=1 Tax=Bremia lactucae TaxID=4779 RepID=A0A976FII4_BRELC|nr:hypothetical protein CCR75_008739 [Bremia lactucae]
MFSPVQESSASTSIDAYDLEQEYGTDAAAKLSRVLKALENAGFYKAHVNSYSAFERVLSGIVWLFQHIVKREDAATGRVQWNVLFQLHDTMKTRLGLTQEVVRCIEALNFPCPVLIQPHQLLLQDFGDILVVEKLVLWLINAKREARHLDKIRQNRAYLQAQSPWIDKQVATPLKKEVAYILDAFAPTRRWQFVRGDGNWEEDEDSLIQRCLLEYGEKMTGIVDDEQSMERNEKNQDRIDCVAQLASQAAAIALNGAEKFKGRAMKGLDRTSPQILQAASFDRQYIEAIKQAKEEQHLLLFKRRGREAELLQQVVAAPKDDEESVKRRNTIDSRTSLHGILTEKDFQVQTLIQENKILSETIKESKARAAALVKAYSACKLELANVEAQTPQDEKAQTQLVQLRELVIKSEELKQEKHDYRTMCRVELEDLKKRVEKLRIQFAEKAVTQDTKALRLKKIEQVHTQMAKKHKEMTIAAAKQTRALQLKMKQIDEFPTPMELVQYEKRFLELYDEVALTLDETRKYYCVHNTLKTTHDFLAKEVSLINSIAENFDVAMGSKTSTQAFFKQIESIIQNLQETLVKQQSVRNEHQLCVEALECTYHVLLEQERKYVNAVREFQKECEKNEKLVARLKGLSR